MTEAEKEIARAAAKDGACYIYFKIFKKNAEMEHCFFFFFFSFLVSFRGIYIRQNYLISLSLFYSTVIFFFKRGVCVKIALLGLFFPLKTSANGTQSREFCDEIHRDGTGRQKDV
jgi:hypothetical protein